MYIPGISSPRGSSLVERSRRLEKRKGGGRGGGGGGGARSGGSSSSGASRGGRSASSADKPPAYSPGAPPPPYSVAGGSAVRGSPGAAGGGRPYSIAPGNSFAGATAGGGTRSQVYTGRGYGSFGFLPFFPFMFWPLYFPAYPYYYGSGIYGPATNDTRPGGFLQAFTLLSPSSTNSTIAPAAGTAPSPDNGFAIYGDNSTVADMVSILGTNCSVYPVYGENYTVTPFNVVQYYRGSSFSLHLDGYNNSLPDIQAQGGENFTIPDVQPAALPAGVNTEYLNCINETIGEYIGLLDSDYVTNGASRSTYSGGLVGTAALLVLAWHTLF